MPKGAIAPDSIAKRKEPTKGFDKKLSKSRTLMGGTEAMREAGKLYLPQFEGESDKHYNLRKQMSYLFNGFRKTVFDMSGRVFEQPTNVSDDASEAFIEWAKDIDMEGRDLSTFAKTVFENGLQSGIEFLLVDAPPAVEGETQAQADSENRRPYIIHIKPEQVIDCKKGRIKNKAALVHFRFKEVIQVKKDEFSSKSVDQIRTFDIVEETEKVLVRTYQENKQGKWEQVDDDLFTGLSEITIIPFYCNRTDYFKGEPPLEDLSDLNIAHWQSQSDQRNILHFVRVPILFARGLPAKTTLKISAASLTKASSEKADLKFVEHTGSSISAGQKDLEHLEFQMETMGLQLIVSKKGPQTATGENRNEKKETSRLSAMADSLQDALEKCFVWMGEYGAQEFDGTIKVFKDFAAGSISSEVLSTLIQSVMNGKISKRTFWKEMVRHGILGEDFDPEVEDVLLSDEIEDIDGMIQGEDE
jgi:hypothetical protein